MAVRPVLSSFKICRRLEIQCLEKATRDLAAAKMSRRGVVAATVLWCKQGLMADAMELRMVTDEQTVEEAESGIRSHAQGLVKVKGLIETESWSEARKAMRLSSSYLKQDAYTIIQSKLGTQRPKLRKLYSNLFNNVTRFDFAAREKNVERVLECYRSVVAALDELLSAL